MKHAAHGLDESPVHVTPCVGVWIETPGHSPVERNAPVTPCVGVWIETRGTVPGQLDREVTPCVGVWIETCAIFGRMQPKTSHPAWVCGLKPTLSRDSTAPGKVTPCVGVWIETALLPLVQPGTLSHPAWVCGLKHVSVILNWCQCRHTLRGCVD